MTLVTGASIWSISRLMYELMEHNPLVGDLAATAAVAATAKP